MATNFLTNKSIGSIILGNNASNNNQPQMAYTQVGVGSTTNYGTIGFGTVTPATTLCWTAGGNVGIGTTAPAAQLHLYTTSSSATRINCLYIYSKQPGIMLDSGQGANGTIWNLFSNINTDDKLAFFTTAGSVNYVMTMQTNGNVGIGTNAPGYTLDIIKQNVQDTSANISIRGYSSLVGSGPGINFFGWNTATTPQGRIEVIDSGSYGGNMIFSVKPNAAGSGGTMNEYMRITNAGNVGIGTNAPNAQLHLYTTSASADRTNCLYIYSKQPGIILNNTQSAGGTTWNIFSNIGGTDGSLAFYTTGTGGYAMTMLANGNVGINTTTPAYTLDVNGNARVSGKILSSTYTINVTSSNTYLITSFNYANGIWLVTALPDPGPSASYALGCSAIVVSNSASYMTLITSNTSNSSVYIQVGSTSWNINLVTTNGVGNFTWTCNILRLN